MKIDRATVFEIERYGIEDGPGIRTVVFLKGCALRCKWCANPESQLFEKQIMFKSNLCKNCRKCLEVCPRKCIEDMEGYGYITTGKECNQCGACVDNCYVNARSIVGIDYTVDEVIKEVLKDEQYYKMSGGGVTFSGGEPFFHYEFINECASELKKYGISILIETCGHVPLKNIQVCSENIDYIFFDIKHMDTNKHKTLTGVGNELILENLLWLNNNFMGELSVRYPYIPGCNDDRQDIETFLDYISKLKNVKQVYFLPYHKLGISKYQGLGRKYEMPDMSSLKFTEIQFLKDYEKKYNVAIKV
ncbi:glycyl-radical enzyme activating protein family [Clostridium sp. Bc-iso-3]|nr:glycyl-radical enzyme activating protein family [Clostridium sp. Bc-iso-3]